MNKVNTKVTLRWDISVTKSVPDDVKHRFVQKFANRVNQGSEVVLQCDKYRSQNRNKEAAHRLLNEMVTSVWRPPKARKKTKPKRSAVEKRLKNKKRHSETKQNRKPIKY